MSSFSGRSHRRVSLAPTQAKDASSLSDEEGASLLMDMSLTELQKGTPGKRKRQRRPEMAEADLDKLSHEELESLAWEAIEEEKRLQELAKENETCTSSESKPIDDLMKNVTVRRKSNSPRKVVDAVLSPLPKTMTMGAAVKHSYDRQASPTRSALRRPYTRKSVAFGEVAEFEISRGEIEMEIESKITIIASSSSRDETSSDVICSSSPLSRFANTPTTLTEVKKTLFKAKAVPTLTRRSSLRSAQGPKADDGLPAKAVQVEAKRKSPIARTRMREAIKESSSKARLKARQSAIKAKEKAKKEDVVPDGFRISSTGTLVSKTKCQPFKVASAPLAPRASSAVGVTSTQTKANPVPAWLKRRKETLRMEEDEKLQKELERVREQELGKEPVGKKEPKRVAKQPQTGFTSAVDKRIAERAAWETKRQAKEDLLKEEKEKAKQERLEREEKEYQLARQRSIVRANPVPDYIRTRSAAK
jgi:hypothetical protein